MFKIGDFSRLTQVPVRTLHYYDQIGLFKPRQVDRFTGYRYYSFEQLPRLNRILALRDLGFSLEQIGAMLDDTITAEALNGMLKLRQAELDQEIADRQQRLERVQARILQIQREGKMADYEVVLKAVAAVQVASARERVPTPELMRERCITLLNEASHLVAAESLRTSGVSLAIYHENALDGIDVEMALLLDTPADENIRLGRASVRTLAAVATMSSVVYHGSYDAFDKVGEVHASLGRWIEANGYQIAGPNREIYLQPPQALGRGLDGVIEIQYPVSRR
jgi:DNA-binding transcriptional MerR regulator